MEAQVTRSGRAPFSGTTDCREARPILRKRRPDLPGAESLATVPGSLQLSVQHSLGILFLN